MAVIDGTTRSIVAALKGTTILLMNAQSVDETKSTVVCPGQGVRNHTVTLIANASVAGVAITGNLALETSNDPTVTNEGWSPFGGGTIDLSTIVIPAGQTKGRLELQFSDVMLTALRGRIDVVVAGGTLSMEYTGN